MDKYVRVPKGDMESYVKKPANGKYNPSIPVKKAKSAKGAATPNEIVKNIL